MGKVIPIIVFFAVVFVIACFMYLKEKSMAKKELDKNGILIHIDRLWFIKGLPELKPGIRVSIDLYHDNVSINNEPVIPLDRIKMARTFSIKEVSVTEKLEKGYRFFNWKWAKRVAIMIYYLGNYNVRHYLSIQFVDPQGCDTIAMFAADRIRGLKSFAAITNQQIGAEVYVPKGLYPSG